MVDLYNKFHISNGILSIEGIHATIQILIRVFLKLYNVAKIKMSFFNDV